MKINYDNADKKIAELQRQGHTVYWRGYDIVLFRATDLGKRRNTGVRHQREDGSWVWGIETVFEPNAQGEWDINLTTETYARGNRGAYA